MSLKSSIVIVNEYTIKTGSKTGSRGGSPGSYVLEYMARKGATEPITPARVHDLDSYIQKYMAREDATETCDSIPSLKRTMKKKEKFGGVGFGYGDVALSDDKLRYAAKDIQNQFDMGKTCLKTVISFDEEFLREHGIIDEDFTCKQKGDYRGHIDQMKLRYAIMNGLDKMSRNYDNLQYIGVIQVDTMHVHCHLCMVDKGRGNLTKDGTQRGKLLPNDKKLLRRGIDTYLDQKQQVKMMASSVSYDKRNAVCYIKKFTHKTLSQQGLPQFLLACLPDNRNLWRASTNRKEMRKPNAIVKEYVLGLLEQPDSGYREAMSDIVQYADYRTSHEGLNDIEHNKLVRNGQQRLIDDCINSVYSVLRTIPKSELTVRTPMLEAMSMDYDDMASQAVNDPMMEFGFKLRSYSSRIKHHRKEYHKYLNEYRNYEDTPNKSEDSKVLGDYLRDEAEYNAMLMTKYQYFLAFVPPEDNIEKEFEELMEEKERLENLRKMREDKALRRMESRAAEEYGLKVYGQRGGRRVRTMPHILDERITRFEDKVKRHEVEFQDKLRDVGLSYDGVGISRKKMYSFDEVKALDLHHLGYDFPYDVGISKRNVDVFCEMAKYRYESFSKAKDYLIRTGQEAAVKLLPETDVVFMKQYADKMQDATVLPTTRPQSGQKRKSRTIRLGVDYTVDMATMVKSTIQAVSMDADLDK